MLVPKVIRRPDGEEDDIILSNSIVTQAVEERVAVLVSDAPHDLRFQASESIVIHRIHSAICAPLFYKGEVLGVLYLDRRSPAKNYQENDLKLVAGIAKQAAQAIANARLHRRLLLQHVQDRELHIARNIQENLLPRTIPEPPGFQIAGLCRPARQVGGGLLRRHPTARRPGRAGHCRRFRQGRSRRDPAGFPSHRRADRSPLAPGRGPGRADKPLERDDLPRHLGHDVRHDAHGRAGPCGPQPDILQCGSRPPLAAPARWAAGEAG